MKNVILGMCCVAMGIGIGVALMFAYPPSAGDMVRHGRTFWLLTIGQCGCVVIVDLILLTDKPLIKREV